MTSMMGFSVTIVESVYYIILQYESVYYIKLQYESVRWCYNFRHTDLNKPALR